MSLNITSYFYNLAEKAAGARLKNVASGCDQCAWPVGVVTGCGHWGGIKC